MKLHWKTTALLLLLVGALSVRAFAINPFLQNREQPATVEFKGTEWNDEYAPKDIPLTAKVVTTQAAKTAWGGIFKISFEDVTSKAEKNSRTHARKPRSKPTKPPARTFTATTQEVLRRLSGRRVWGSSNTGRARERVRTGFASNGRLNPRRPARTGGCHRGLLIED